MIESFGTMYAGHIELEEVGLDSTPANDRLYSEEQLNTVYSKTESIAKVLDENGYSMITKHIIINTTSLNNTTTLPC